MSTIASRDTGALQPRTSGRSLLNAPEIAFAALLLLGAVLVMVETRGLSFFGDEWDFVVDRRGISPHVLLEPHGPHLSLLPILVYKAMLQVFGADSYVPYRLLAAFDLVLIAAVLGWVCRSLWGPWWGLAPVLLLVTLGPGAITLLWPFQVGYALAVAGGVVALVAAGREGRAAATVCCVALVVSLASASAGVGFVVGVAVVLAFRQDKWQRSWVVLVPLVLYVLWYLGYGQDDNETHLSLWKDALSYSMQALAATSAATVGLSSVSPQTGLLDGTFGVPIAVAAVAAVAVASWRGWRPTPLFWGVAATLVVLFVAACLSNWGPYPRAPGTPRYLPINATLVLICVCAALPRPRLGRLGVIVACLVLAAVSATNAAQYAEQHRWLSQSDTASRAELGALLILRGVVSPDFSPATPGDPAVLVNIRAGSFYEAVDSFGIIADSPSELLQQDEATRELADGVLLRGGVTLAASAPHAGKPAPPPAVISGKAGFDGRCLVVGAVPLIVRAAPGTYELTAKKFAMDVSGGRFGDAYSARIGSVPRSTSAVITVKRDAAPQTPWRIQTTGTGGRICRLPA
jgi:hypothetical protein